MKQNALVLALVTAATALPGSVQAADDICSRMFIYAVNQFCQLLPNGQTLCQPIGLAGPAPSCESPSAKQLVQVPLGPPTIQMSPFSPFGTAPNPYAPNPYAANRLAPNPYAPFPFAPNPYTAFPSAPAATYAPPSLPFPPLMPLVAAAPIKPAAGVESAPSSATTKALTKLMPEAAAKTPEPLGKPAAGTSLATTAAANSVPVATSVAAAPTPASKPEVTPAIAIAPLPTIKPVEDDKAAKIEDALAHFAFDSAELTEAGRTMLNEWLAKASAALTILVTGHADRLGPEPYNEKLSLRRAEAVKKYLSEKGKPANQIQIIAKGEAIPVIRCPGDANLATKECLAPNRRAEIVAKPVVAKPAAKTATKAVAKPIKPKVKP